MSDRAATATWDRNAARYAAQEGLEARALLAAVRLAAPGPEDTLVDLATGTGALLRVLAAAASRPGRAVGVDRSAAMLAAVGPLPEGWRTLQADARAVPLPDGTADVVTCAYALQLLPRVDRDAVLREARRLLRPGGRLVLVTPWAGRRPGALLLRGAALGAPARLGGLMPLDPAPELPAAGFRLLHRIRLPRGGYPSLVLAAIR